MALRWLLIAGFLLASRPVAAAPLCAGDCDGAGTVTVDELVKGVGVALGSLGLPQCEVLDGNQNGAVTVDELVLAVNNALTGCPTFVGEYFGTAALADNQSGTMLLTVNTDGSATAMVVIADGALSGFGASLTGGSAAVVSFSIAGTVDLDTGAYTLGGSFVVNGTTYSINVSGVLPIQPSGQGSFDVQINSTTFTGSIGRGNGSTPTPTRTRTQAPTPTATPTQSGPPPTPPTGTCADGVFAITAANLSADTNLAATAVTLGRVTALDAVDSTGNSYVWTVTAAPCALGLNDVGHTLILQASGITTRIQPGTYQLGSSTPPFLGFTFNESRFNPLAPAGNFSRYWGSTGGTVVIEDGGGGTLRVRATGVPMGPHPFIKGGTGTFALDLNGVITKVMR